MSTLLAIDVGNSNVSLGLFVGDVLTHRWRLQTHAEATSDELSIALSQLFALRQVHSSAIHSAAIASVRAGVGKRFAECLKCCFALSALLIDVDMCAPLTIGYRNPKELGVDRLVNAVAAHHRLQLGASPTGLVVVDVGTATTLDAISSAAVLLGGLIVPGPEAFYGALRQRAPALPQVDFSTAAEAWQAAAERSAIARSTHDALSTGLLLGYVALLDGLIDATSRDLGEACRVLLTGGAAKPLLGLLHSPLQYVEELTLEGIRLIANRYA